MATITRDEVDGDEGFIVTTTAGAKRYEYLFTITDKTTRLAELHSRYVVDEDGRERLSDRVTDAAESAINSKGYTLVE